MEPKQTARLEAIHQRGLRRYVLFDGILFYGSLMFIFTTLDAALFRSQELSARWLGISAIVWATAGAVSGAVMLLCDGALVRFLKRRKAR